MTKIQSLSDDEFNCLIERARILSSEGRCCPVSCGIDRTESIPPCSAAAGGVKVASFAVHRGEEPPVSGVNGAGNVFFSGCSMGCVYCQNYPFSALNAGKFYNYKDFASKIIDLAGKKKIHNINLTTSEHYIYEILKALYSIREKVNIPVAYNCSGYHSADTLEIMGKTGDIFLYDLKYSDEFLSSKYSAVKNYVEISFAGAEYFIRNPVKWSEKSGILESGLIIRHLILPGAVQNSKGVIDRLFRLKKAGLDFRFSLMCQYFPAYKAAEETSYEDLSRKITVKEYDELLDYLDGFCFEGWVQDYYEDGNC